MAVYTDDYVVCRRVIKILCIDIMAEAISSVVGSCVKHDSTDERGKITAVSGTDHYSILTENNENATWHKDKVTFISGQNDACDRIIVQRMSDLRRSRPIGRGGGKRKTRRGSRKLRRKSRKNRK